MLDTCISVINKINKFSEDGIPFLFAIDFEMDQAIFVENPLNQTKILFNVNGITNHKQRKEKSDFVLTKAPIPEEEYAEKFSIVQKGLKRGDSYLLNLTVQTPISCSLSLLDIFEISKEKYKLYIPDMFVCFSPERFVRIADGRIFSNPMKGTIDTSVPNAYEVILNDYKEKSEHYTIVDLIRNDLNMVSTDVKVEKFRYIESITKNDGEILQVSSEIVGKLPNDYRSKLGDIILKLLPAGSISGAPKESSLSIIRESEGKKRGFYTGVFGYFDGKDLDTAVLIRYIEEIEAKKYFRSGGGITINSVCENEYTEVLQKVYIPK